MRRGLHRYFAPDPTLFELQEIVSREGRAAQIHERASAFQSICMHPLRGRWTCVGAIPASPDTLVSYGRIRKIGRLRWENVQDDAIEINHQYPGPNAKMCRSLKVRHQLHVAVSAEIIRHWEPMRVYHPAAPIVLVQAVPIAYAQRQGARFLHWCSRPISTRLFGTFAG